MKYWNFIKRPSWFVLPLHVLVYLFSYPLGYALDILFQIVFGPSSYSIIGFYLFELTRGLGTVLLILGLINFAYFMRNKLVRGNEVKMISFRTFIAGLVLFVVLAYILTPKLTGSGGICDGCEILRCKCLGFEHFDGMIPGDTTCIGLVYGCERSAVDL